MLLRNAGVVPAIAISGGGGKHLPNVEVVRWKNGGQEIVALFRQEGQREDAEVSLAARGPRHVYDLRNRKAMERTERFATAVIPNRASFFVLTSSTAPAPTLVLDRQAASLGTVVKGSVCVTGAEGLHAFRIRGRVGDRPLEWLDRNVIAGQEPKAFDIPLAHNDPTGEYEMMAIDLLTEAPASVRLGVRPAE
jgi:hypothetical protein